MHRVQARRAVGQGGIVAGAGHAITGFGVRAVAIGSQHVLAAQAYGLARKHHGQAGSAAITRVRAAAPIKQAGVLSHEGFNCVGQGINTGVGSDARWAAIAEFRIDNRNGGAQRIAHDGDFGGIVGVDQNGARCCF